MMTGLACSAVMLAVLAGANPSTEKWELVWSDEFNVGSMAFEDRIDFFVDQTKYFTFKNEGTGNDTWPFDKPHYLIVNAAYGGSRGGQKGTDDAILPQKYLIDYVRVYKSK